MTHDPRNAHVADPLRSVLNAVAPKVRPVVYVTCPVCQGDGWIETGMDNVGIGSGRTCCTCAGRGRIATEQGEV